jgi:hypothetical protein
MHLNLATGQLLNSSNLIKIADSLILDRKSGKIVLSNLLVPRAGALPTLFGDATLDLNFASSLSLDDAVSGNNLITFSRASSGTYVGSDGLIKTAVTDAPRFDHDPVTGESLGLLIEESRTNLVTYSEQLNNAAWGQISTGVPVVTPNILTAPDGTITGDLVVGNDANTWIANNVGAVGAGQYNFSVWLKSDIAQTADIFMSYGVTDNLVCSVTTNWQRFTLTATRAATSGLFVGVNVGNAKNIYIWGAQLEEGSFPTSYIPTTSSTVTRATDVTSITGTNFSSWYNQSEGTAFAEYDGLKDYARVLLLNIGKTLILNRPIINSAYDGATETASVADLGLTLGDTRKSVTAYSGTTTTVTINGLVPVTGNSDFTSTTSDGIYLGGQGNDANVLNGHISRFAYFSTRKSDEELIELTQPN